MVNSDDLMTRSGRRKPSRTPFHSLSVMSGLGGGISFGLPSGAPSSTQRTMEVICTSLSDMSFLNFCTPTLGSMCQGGIWRVATRSLIDFAQGRASLYVIRDIGAMEFG